MTANGQGWPEYRRFGRTELMVSPVGLGGGAQVAAEDVLYAFDAGINYFFYSADLHHHLYLSMAPALRRLCGRGSATRSSVVLATVTYVNRPRLLPGILFDQFRELKIDFIDVLFWGCIGAEDRLPFAACMQSSPYIRGPGTAISAYIEKLQGVSEELKRMGAVRYVGASFHSLDVAQEWIGSPALDVMMVRYNPAHRAGASRVLDKLPRAAERRQGTVTFKATTAASGPLFRTPQTFQCDDRVANAATYYRYPLSHPNVDVCLAGLKSRVEIDEALRAVRKGPLTEEEIGLLERYGDELRGRRPPA